jgi:hypothetical protein
MYVNGKNTVVKDNATTPDIIEALLNATPAAVNQCKGYVYKMIEKSGNPLVDAERCCRYIRANVNYKADGFSEQNIQLPGRMFKNTKQADCKSFSLAFVGMMEALGYDAGFRFASYRPNKIPTHVYNFVLCNGKKYIFDACIENLKESPRHTYIQDMKVQYLSAPNRGFDYPAFAKQLQDQGKTKAEIAEAIKKLQSVQQGLDAATSTPGRGKKILLAPVRAAFFTLLSLNVRGLASKLAKAIEKDSATTKSMWERLGGNFNTLKEKVSANKNKKALFGGGVNGVGFYSDDTEQSYIGVVDWVLIGTIVATATPALIAVSALLKKNNIPEGEGNVITAGEADAGAKLPADFEAADPEPGSGTGAGLNLGFKPSPLVIGGIVGGLALVYFLVIKKKK